jgi:hypothetical protein
MIIQLEIANNECTRCHKPVDLVKDRYCILVDAPVQEYSPLHAGCFVDTVSETFARSLGKQHFEEENK